MEIGCYTLDLYCDVEDCVQSDRWNRFMSQYTGRTRSECWKNARKDGWRSIAEKQVCPGCRKSGKKIPAGRVEIP